MYHNSLQAQLDVTELLLKFLSVDFINDVHLSKNHTTDVSLTYSIVSSSHRCFNINSCHGYT